ncbi:AAA family ATPase [Runella sp.]|uniref:AAA family ATPase n=1 Tax=Runella sp. TaxID=1960881 RepID=UPI003D0BE775
MYSADNKKKGSSEKESFLERFNSSFITDMSDIQDPVPFVTVNGSTFASLGDISFISGAPKAGKSSVTGFILATALMKDKPRDLDSLGIISNYQGERPIIYIDTEQHPAHTRKRLKIVLKMAGIERQNTDRLKVMNWRVFPQKLKYENLIHALDSFKDACLWVIDGITDFVTSANNEETGNELIGFLMQKASENNAAIILLIHENPQNGKMRGHIGSEAERKCGGAISIKKDREKDLHFIEPKYLRDAEDFTPVVFRYDKTQGRMVSVDAQTSQLALQEQKDKSKGSELKQLYDTCMGAETVLPRAEFRKRIEDHYDPHKEKLPTARETYANRMVRELEKAFFIRLTGSGKNQTVEPFAQLDGLLMQNDKLF